MSDIWITDRQPPSMADEDGDGEVGMLRFPDGRKSSGGRKDALVSASHVGPGVPWKHTHLWKPPAEPAPIAAKPQPQPGEVWRHRNGKIGTIRANSLGAAAFPLVSDIGLPGGFHAHYPDGRSCTGNKDYDLVERLEVAASPKPPLAVGQVWRRRDGRVISIAKYGTKHLYGSTHPFITERDHSYTREGAWSADGTTESPYDLVGLLREAPAPKPGETWKYRNGTICKLRANPDAGSSFPILSDRGCTHGYKAHYPDGRSCLHDKDYDLVQRLEAAPSPKPPLAVGQVWRRRDNKVVTIDGYRTTDTLFPFTTSSWGSFTYTREGSYLPAHTAHPFDLVELISEAPAPAPAPAPKPPLAVGQVWCRRDGNVAVIKRIDPSDTDYPVVTHEGYTYTSDGNFLHGNHYLDLVKLISEAPASKPPEPGATPPSRQFRSVTRTVFSDGTHVLDAVDEDGAAWWLVLTDNPPEDNEGWKPMRPLPAREPSHVGSSLPEV